VPPIVHAWDMDDRRHRRVCDPWGGWGGFAL
jgi:hypothetical protein